MRDRLRHGPSRRNGPDSRRWGMRSQQVSWFLESSGFTRVYNLQGGVDRWAQEVDPAMRKY